VTCAIPGAKSPAQVAENVAAADLRLLPAEPLSRIREVYDHLIRPQVHQLW
jgi:aryl-alcohol dehydrogenase-like predicted oxidoreductase